MSKYIKPEIEILELESADVITASSGVEIGELKGVDDGNSKTAIFNAGFWMQ